MENTFDSIDAFNFDAMTQAVGKDPFAAQANKYAKDERFYTLTKDKDGNGAALIRFIPDIERGRIMEIFKINTTITKNGKKRFVNEFTPATIGQPCPFQEKWSELYNAGDIEGAKNFGRSKKFISNIKVIKDPANPENEGKIFLYEYSGAMKAKLESAQKVSDIDKGMGKVAKELFNPLKGNSFRLVAQKGSNGQINYDASEVVQEETSIYADVQAAVSDIQTNTYLLSGLIKADAFMSYDELVKKMNWVTWADQVDTPTTIPEANVSVASVASVVPEVQPSTLPQVDTPQAPQAQADELDALLKGLV